MVPPLHANAANRLARAAAFVAIVWAVAASFIALELASIAGFDRLLGNAPMRAIALPNAVRDSTACNVPQSDGHPPRGDATRDADAAAWLLGVKAGMHQQMSQSLAASSPQANPGLQQTLSQTGQEIDRLASFLNVPRPVSYTPRNNLDANTEFMTAVEADPDGTARAIAVTHAEDACHVYKLGAYWGYAMMIRIALPGERSAFAIEIEHHASKAGLPHALWRPVVDRTASNATAEELLAESIQITDAITAHLRTGEASAGGREGATNGGRR